MGGIVGGDSPIGDLSNAPTLVIAGPPMTGKYTLMLEILAHYSDETIIITTKNPASRVLEDYESIIEKASHGRIGVIECVSKPGGLEESESNLIKRAGSPENLTRIGVKFTELFELFYENGPDSNVGVGLHSLSQLLMHSELKNVYQFLHVLISQIQSADWLCVAVLDTTVGEETRQTLYHHFDGIVETRENQKGQREYRVRGFDPSSSDWSAF